VYQSDYYADEQQRTGDRRVEISHPEIKTSAGHRFASNADRISVLRKNIFECKK
jgi:hypothetical protein